MQRQSIFEDKNTIKKDAKYIHLKVFFLYIIESINFQ